MTQKPIIVGVDDSPEGVRAARLALLIVPTRRFEQPTEWVESPTRVRHGTVMT